MTEQRQQWRNRIVGHSEEDPASLLAHPLNWKIDTELQRAALQGAIAALGFTRSVTVDRDTKLIVDGHERVSLAVDSGQQTIPVEWVELNEDEITLALTEMDAIAWMAKVEQDNLKQLMELDALAENVQLYNFLNGSIVDWGDGPREDYYAHWQAMPEYHQENQEGFKLMIHFRTVEEKLSFSDKLEQTITEQTRAVWYPPQENNSERDKRYISDPDADVGECRVCHEPVSKVELSDGPDGGRCYECWDANREAES